MTRESRLRREAGRAFVRSIIAVFLVPMFAAAAFLLRDFAVALAALAIVSVIVAALQARSACRLFDEAENEGFRKLRLPTP